MRHNRFPGEIFMAVAADALRMADTAPNHRVADRALLGRDQRPTFTRYAGLRAPD